MSKLTELAEKISSELATLQPVVSIAFDEITIEIDVCHLIDLLTRLKTYESFHFDELIDLCAVDYLHYGISAWETESAANTGFSRGVEPEVSFVFEKPRFAVVYHLLSTRLNHRVRVKVFLHEANLVVPSVHTIWKTANWFEREAYDLYGVLFENHPDLRRILTDYGFIGHPFRKDFPLSGHVEMRYDATLKKVIYEPVDIEERVLVPKVIREEHREPNDIKEHAHD